MGQWWAMAPGGSNKRLAATLGVSPETGKSRERPVRTGHFCLWQGIRFMDQRLSGSPKNILTGLYYGSFRAECLCYAPNFAPSRGGCAIDHDWRFLTRIRGASAVFSVHRHRGHTVRRWCSEPGWQL
ncbi:hypothetical protein C4K23_3292 [Pseudomonas chlororaphis]|nr:hypothetical protein C4K23_3292 [Pseudomonas chlororaphis]